MDIALYGGSFDPPHLGHVAVVNEALKTLDIDKVIVVPAFVNPFKAGTHAPAELRLEWLKAIFKANSRVEVSDFEIRLNRAVRSIETVSHFGALYEKIYFIIGADNLATLKQWHRYEELNSLVTWVVATRDEIEIEPGFIRLNVDQKISSSALRERILEQKLPTSVAMSIKDYYKSTSKDPK